MLMDEIQEAQLSENDLYVIYTITIPSKSLCYISSVDFSTG